MRQKRMINGKSRQDAEFEALEVVENLQERVNASLNYNALTFDELEEEIKKSTKYGLPDF